MTFTDAACEVLRKSGRPLHYKEITELAIENNLLSHVGKSPEVTMGARLAATLKKGGDDNPLVRVKPGVFALREWDEETISKGLEVARSATDSEADGEDEGDHDEALFDAAAAGAEPEDEDLEEPRAEASEPAVVDPVLAEVPPSPDEEMRAEIAAGASDVFAEEEDDDQPILRPLEDEPEPGGDPRRRRRRRRRRGARSGAGDGPEAQLPSYTATPVTNGEPGGAPRGPQVIELGPGEVPALDQLAGKALADAIAAVLGSFDRAVGAVSLRQIAEAAQRSGKLGADPQLAQAQIAAAVRADNARRLAAGARPRFRLAAGRVGLTEWLLDGELGRAERELATALQRYRDSARRAFVRKCAELPAHAFVELSLMVLDRAGVSAIRVARFPGASGAESHFVGTLYAPLGTLAGPLGTTAGLRLAIVVRRDGRDIGRERVIELRGSAHHFEGAEMGWILTTGQVLSGAREEATAPGSLPVTLFDGQTIARMCEEHDLAVLRTTNVVAIPDVDLFEGLRAC